MYFPWSLRRSHNQNLRCSWLSFRTYPRKTRPHCTTTVNCAVLEEVFVQGANTKKEKTTLKLNLSFTQVQYDKLMTLLQHPTCASIGLGCDDSTQSRWILPAPPWSYLSTLKISKLPLMCNNIISFYSSPHLFLKKYISD